MQEKHPLQCKKSTPSNSRKAPPPIQDKTPPPIQEKHTLQVKRHPLQKTKSLS